MNYELLNDYEFNPNFKDIKNNLIQAYYNHDDTELSNLFNQLGKSFEKFEHFKDAALCHSYDACICQIIKSEKGLAVALANLSIDLSMKFEGFPSFDEKCEVVDTDFNYDFGYFLFFEQSYQLVKKDKTLQELVFRKNIISGYNAFRVAQYQDIFYLQFIYKHIKEYYELFNSFKLEEMYWEVLVTIFQVYLWANMTKDCQILWEFLRINITYFQKFDNLAQSFVLFSFQLSFKLFLEIDNFVFNLAEATIKNIVKKQKLVNNLIQEIVDIFIQFGQTKYFHWLKKISKFYASPTLQNNIKSQLQLVIQEIQFIDSNPQDSGIIKTLLQYQLLQYDLSHTHTDKLDFAVFNFRKLQNTSMNRSKQIFLDDIIKFLSEQDQQENASISPVQLLGMIIEDIYLWAKYDITKSLQNVILVVYYFLYQIGTTKQKNIQSTEFDDFLEQILSAYHRNQTYQIKQNHSTFLDSWDIKLQHQHQYCADYLIDYLGFQYSEDSFVQKLRQDITIDQIMIQSQFISKIRQSKVLQLLKNPQSKVLKVQKNSKVNIVPLKTQSIDAFLIREQPLAQLSNSYTESITEEDLVQKPKLLSKSPMCKSPQSFLQFDDLNQQIEPFQTPTLVKTKESCLNDDQIDYQDYQVFIQTYNFTNLDINERMNKYKEFIYFKQTFGTQTKSQSQKVLDEKIIKSPMIETISLQTKVDQNQCIQPSESLQYFTTQHFSIIQKQDSIYVAKEISKLDQNLPTQVTLFQIELSIDIIASLQQLKNLIILIIDSSSFNISLQLEVLYLCQKKSISEIVIKDLKYTSFSLISYIIISSSATKFTFTNILGYNIQPLSAKIQPQNREIQSVEFINSNFISIEQIDILACILEIKRLIFSNCLNQDNFSTLLNEQIEIIY